VKRPCKRCRRPTRHPAFCCALCSVLVKGWADRFRRKRTESPRFVAAVENRARTMLPPPWTESPEHVWGCLVWLSRLHEIPEDDRLLRMAADGLRGHVERADGHRREPGAPGAPGVTFAHAAVRGQGARERNPSPAPRPTRWPVGPSQRGSGGNGGGRAGGSMPPQRPPG
jgi:hypothetical protein